MRSKELSSSKIRELSGPKKALFSLVPGILWIVSSLTGGQPPIEAQNNLLPKVSTPNQLFLPSVLSNIEHPATFPPSEIILTIILGADNNLEGAAIDDYLEAAEIGSTAEVTVLMLVDRAGEDPRYGGWTDTRLFKVTKNSEPLPENAIHSFGELNTGNPQDLKRVINFINQIFPLAPNGKNFLILWDHGSGIDHLVTTQNEQLPPEKSVLFDNTSNDELTPVELRQLLQSFQNRPWHILGYDTCVTALVELLGQTADLTLITVASQDNIGFDGFNYNVLTRYLTENPRCSPEGFALKMVYSHTEGDTLSAFENSEYPKLESAISQMAEALMQKPQHKEAYKNLRSTITRIYYFKDWYIDLYSLTDLILSSFPSESEICSTARSVKDCLTNGLIAVRGKDSDHGLSIYWPPADLYPPYFDQRNLLFTEHTSWDEFLSWLNQ